MISPNKSRTPSERLNLLLPSGPGKVLIAEDEPISAELLRTLLARAGYEVIMTSDGAAAWEEFDREPVRLIVSDWMMPGMDGLELCRKVRARSNTAYTYFILLTANHTSADNYALAMDAGVDDFLTKPLDRTVIRMRLGVAERILRFTAEIRQLKELIPICMYCRKVRDEDDYWERVETYIQKETGSKFSHGACPECYEIQKKQFDEVLAGSVDLAAH